MSKHTSSSYELLHAIYQTTEQEIYCDAAQLLMARCADQLLMNDVMRLEYPELWRHLQVCADCAAEYALTLELAQREAAGTLAHPAAIPPVPALEPERSLWEQATQVFKVAFPGFTPAAQVAVRSGTALPAEPTSITWDIATLTLDLAVSAEDPTTCDLLLTFEVPDAEGMPLALQESGVGGLIVQEQACNAYGEVQFTSVAPGLYLIRILWRGREYQIQEILVP